MLRNKRNRGTEKPAPAAKSSPHRLQVEKPAQSNDDSAWPKQKNKKTSLLRFRAKLVSWLLGAGGRP